MFKLTIVVHEDMHILIAIHSNSNHLRKFFHPFSEVKS